MSIKNLAEWTPLQQYGGGGGGGHGVSWGFPSKGESGSGGGADELLSSNWRDFMEKLIKHLENGKMEKSLLKAMILTI